MRLLSSDLCQRHWIKIMWFVRIGMVNFWQRIWFNSNHEKTANPRDEQWLLGTEPCMLVVAWVGPDPSVSALNNCGSESWQARVSSTCRQRSSSVPCCRSIAYNWRSIGQLNVFIRRHGGSHHRDGEETGSWSNGARARSTGNLSIWFRVALAELSSRMVNFPVCSWVISEKDVSPSRSYHLDVECRYSSPSDCAGLMCVCKRR